MLDADGNALVSFGYGDYEPAYTRDLSGHALFSKDGAEAVEYYGTTYEIPAKEYYYIENGEMVRSDYNDLTDNRGLYFDYPAYYGVSDTDINRFPNVNREITPTEDIATKKLSLELVGVKSAKVFLDGEETSIEGLKDLDSRHLVVDISDVQYA